MGRTPGRRQTHIRRLARLSFVVAFAGCASDPIALCFTAKTGKSIYAADEPIDVHVTLQTQDRPVALWRVKANWRYAVSLTRSDGSLMEQGQVVQCGTAALVLLPIAPFIVVAKILDVADVGGRFTVLPKSKQTQESFSVLKSHGSIWIQSSDASQMEHADWISGDYLLRVELRDDTGAIPPIGWRPYATRLRTELPVRVVPVLTTSGPARE